MRFLLENVETAVVMGAGRGIGHSLVERLLSVYPDVKVHATYRELKRAQDLLRTKELFPGRLELYKVDPCSEQELAEFSTTLKESSISEIDFLVNSVGVLHDDKVFPERKLGEVSVDALDYYFRVNSSVSVLIAKYMQPFFKNLKPSCFASISAKLGSIEDNRSGGWYGYRASKAALNMFLKGIAIEYNRRGGKCVVTAVHPGTTVTNLSMPFNKKTSYTLHAPSESAKNILSVLDGAEISERANFRSWDKSYIPW